MIKREKEKKSYLYKIIKNNIDKTINGIRLKKEGSSLNRIRESYLNENNNKGLKIQRINKLNSWENQRYLYDRDKEIKIWIIDRLVRKLMSKIFRLKINKINKEIYIGRIMIKQRIKKVEIEFNYLISLKEDKEEKKINKYYTSIITDINNILINENNGSNKLIRYLSKLYGKEVRIKANKIRYYYNDNIILNKMILNELEKYKGGLLSNYSKILKGSIPRNNDKLIKNKLLLERININKIKNKNIDINIKNKMNIKNIYRLINKERILKNLLINRYIIGLCIIFKGKKLNLAGASRTIKNKLLIGSLSNKLYGKYTNFIPKINKLKSDTPKGLVPSGISPAKLAPTLGGKGINLKLFINKLYKLNYISSHHNIIKNKKVNLIKTGTFGVTTKLNTI